LAVCAARILENEFLADNLHFVFEIVSNSTILVTSFVPYSWRCKWRCKLDKSQ
jgi:hypothetical protein